MDQPWIIWSLFWRRWMSYHDIIEENKRKHSASKTAKFSRKCKDTHKNTVSWHFNSSGTIWIRFTSYWMEWRKAWRNIHADLHNMMLKHTRIVNFLWHGEGEDGSIRYAQPVVITILLVTFHFTLRSLHH